MQQVGLKIAVKMRGIIIERPPKDFVPFVETRIRAEHSMYTHFSPFTRGMVWGIAFSLLVWGLTSVIAAKLWV
jgi:hypothetical protein